jgi:hypothetical protein
MVAQELLQALYAFSVKSRSAAIDLRKFIASTRPKASDAEIETALRELESAGKCVLAPDSGMPQTATFSDYFLILLEEEFRVLTVEPSKPFPQEGTFAAPIPPSRIFTVDIKTDFASLLAEPGDSEHVVAKLVFPEGIDILIVPRRSAGGDLIEAAVTKLAAYLSDPKNAGFVESKLMSIFRGNDVIVRQMVEDAATRPKKAAQSVFSPSDFGFRFWTYLVNLVLQDFRKKKEKTSQDQGVCQSAYIVGYYAFFRKSQAQKEQERSADRKSLEILVRKPPYIFTFEGLYALADDKGVPFVTKHTHEFIHSFLQEKTRRTGDESLPFIIRLHDSARGKDYFIQKDILVPVFLKKLSEAAEELRDQYITDWVAALRRHMSQPVMKNDSAFENDVDAKVRQGFPLLAVLANAPLLYLAKSEANLTPEAREEIRRCFEHDNSLRPLAELMGLFRQILYSEARSYLPIWETMPVLSQIVALFRRLFSGTHGAAREQSAGTPVRRSQPAPRQSWEDKAPAARSQAARTAAADRDLQARYRRALQLLRDRFVPLGKSAEKTLDELAEKWNPLFAEGPKRELVEDVNALVRDFLRPVKRTFLVNPPDMARIHALAEQLSGSRSLEKIKKKEPLLRYIELYMITCLEPSKRAL